jgi:hypothetical protein
MRFLKRLAKTPATVGRSSAEGVSFSTSEAKVITSRSFSGAG